MGTKKNNHTDPIICFRCFESDFRWYFQWTFLKIKKRWKKIKKTLKNAKKRALDKKRKNVFFTSMMTSDNYPWRRWPGRENLNRSIRPHCLNTEFSTITHHREGKGFCRICHPRRTRDGVRGWHCRGIPLWEFCPSVCLSVYVRHNNNNNNNKYDNILLSFHARGFVLVAKKNNNNKKHVLTTSINSRRPRVHKGGILAVFNGVNVV